MKIYTLPKTNNKAKVIINDNKEVLFSYDTEVATFDLSTNKATVNALHSATTLKHIKLFLESNGYPTMTKKEIEKEFNL